MKIGLILFIIMLLCTPAAKASIYDIKDYCADCSKEINLENEIEKFLEETQCPISLDEALDVALVNNFNIKAKYETYKSYEYLHKYRLAKFLPDFNYEFYSIYYRGQVLVGSALVDKFDELALSSVVSIRHSLTEGGRQIFEAKEAKFKKYERREELKYSKEETLKDTSIAYFQLLQAKINIEIHLKNLYERTIQLKLTETMKEAGMGTDFDVIRQKNEVENAKRTVIEALNNFRIAQAALSNIMGIEIKTPLYPIESEVIPLNLVNSDISVDELYLTAEKNRKDISAIRNEIKAMKNEKRTFYTDLIPKPRILFQHQNQGTAAVGLGEANVVGLYVDYDFGENLGIGTIAKLKAAEHEINSRKYELTDRLRKIKEELLKTYYNSKLLLEKIKITNKKVDYATNSVSLAEMRLDSGEGILIDVIQAQNQKTIARIEYLEAVIEYNINQIELLFNQGIIDIEKIVEKYNS